MKAFWLTTKDNKWNPFTHTDEWAAYDDLMDYGCSSILARLVPDSEDLLPSERNDLIEAAIDKFIAADPTGMYMKLVDENNNELPF